MKHVFPSKLLHAIAGAEEFHMSGDYGFGTGFASLYECWPIDDFNSLLFAEMLRLHKDYGFHPTEHSNWVTPRMEYKIHSRPSVIRQGEHRRLLNSWALKDPVSFVPAEELLLEELEWTNLLYGALSKKRPAPVITLDKLHHDYVVEACRQTHAFHLLLAEWRKAGKPTSQEECLVDHKAEKLLLKSVLKDQRLNELDAKERAQVVAKAGAPQFLIDASLGNWQRESEISKQVQEAICMC